VNNIQRVSPHQQQIINTFQQTSNSNNNSSQLSPRQASFTQQPTPQAQPNSANWNPQSNPTRLNLQQNNPMLNAQLSVRIKSFDDHETNFWNSELLAAATKHKCLCQSTTVQHPATKINKLARQQHLAAE
jgi:hypothetical protein